VEQKQHSGLGIAGMIIGIVALLLSCLVFGGFLGIIGLIISLIGVTQKNRKSGTAIAGIVLNTLAICIMILMLIIAFSNDASQTTENTTNTEFTESSPAPITIKPQNTDDGIIDITQNGCTLKYLRHEIATNASGDNCLVVYYQFTNNSSDTTSYLYTFSDQAFQNGIELDKSLFLMDDIEDNRSKDIRPGVSVEVYSLFVPHDNSTIELEVSEWISFSDKPLDKMELALE
jgi:hypothetical protein